MEKSRLPYGVCRSGRSDRGGEHTCGPAHAEMTAASRRAPSGNRGTGCATRRPGPHEGQAAGVEEATGRGTPRAAGGGGQARREGCAERTAGRSSSQQGLPATFLDLVGRSPPRHEEGGGWAQESVRAMTAGARLLTWSPRARQGRYTWRVHRDSGHVAAPGVPRHVGPANKGAPVEVNQSVPGCMWVSPEASCVLGRRPTGSQGRHRPGEIPPSGIAGGPVETWTMAELGPHLAYRKSECWKLSA